MRRAIRTVGAVVLVAAALLGIPWLLLTAGSVPPAHRWIDAVTGPDDGSLLVGVLTVAGWILWGLITLTVVIEMIAVGSRQRLRIRLPGLGWLQSASGAVVVTILGPVAPALAAPMEPPPVLLVAPQEHLGHITDHSAPLTDREREHIPAPGTGITHRVQAGEDLWSLAEHYYRDGTRWREIAVANSTVLTGGPDVLEPGWALFIPTVPERSGGPHVRVAAGDTLSAIAERHLGDAARWNDLWDLNRAVIADPDVLPTGLLLHLPRSVDSTADENQRTPREEGTGPQVQESPDSTSPSPRSERSEPTTPAAEPRRTSDDTSPEEGASPVTIGTAETEAAFGPDIGLLSAGIGGLVAAGLLGSFGVRRILQLHERPVGRRVLQPEPAAQRLLAELHHVQRPGGRDALERARHLIAAYCDRTGIDPPMIDHVRLGADHLEIVPVQPAAPPDGFGSGEAGWVLIDQGAHAVPVLPDPWPALICVGTHVDDVEILIDLETFGEFGVDLGDPQAEAAFGCAVITELASRPNGPTVVVVGQGRELVTAAAASHVQWTDDLDRVLEDLTERAAHHHAEPNSPSPRGIRLDPDRADAWQPTVLVLNTELSVRQRRELAVLVADPRSPVAVVRIGAPSGAQLLGDSGSALLEPAGITIAPQQVGPVAEFAVIDLFRVTGTNRTTTAPWWSNDSAHLDATTPSTLSPVTGANQELPVLQPHSAPAGAPRPAAELRSAPFIRLLGPIELENAAGPEPTRARKQCIEYCAWLLENPGRTSREMAAQLFVAETTRRSNMSRLRSWLGHDPEGRPYLPEAYSGRITLHEEVTSDAHLLHQLLPGNLRSATDAALTAALDLVRGAPLADAAPQQWGWAEELRLDLVSMIRDVAAVLAERAAAAGDLEGVRWATMRGLSAAPEDEVLQSIRLRAEHRAGNHSEAERIARRMVVRARTLGVDLLDETVELLQEIAEGQVRARRAM